MWLAYKQTDSCQIQFIEAVDAVLEHLRNSVWSTYMFLETFAPKPSSTGRLSCRRYVTLPFFFCGIFSDAGWTIASNLITFLQMEQRSRFIHGAVRCSINTSWNLLEFTKIEVFESFIVLAWSYRAACIIAVPPALFEALTMAPLSSSAIIQPSCPWHAAHMRGGK